MLRYFSLLLLNRDITLCLLCSFNTSHWKMKYLTTLTTLFTQSTQFTIIKLRDHTALTARFSSLLLNWDVTLCSQRCYNLLLLSTLHLLRVSVDPTLTKLTVFYLSWNFMEKTVRVALHVDQCQETRCSLICITTRKSKLYPLDTFCYNSLWEVNEKWS